MTPQRIIDIIGALLIALVGVALAVNVVRDPLAKDRAWLADQLKQAGLSPSEEATSADFAAWQKSIAAKPDLWKAISPPPAAPKPQAPAACKPPTPDELAKKVKEEGIRFTRSQIGQKIKVVIGDNKRGEFHTEGEAVKAYTIKAFDRTSVTLTFDFLCPDKTTETVEFTVTRE